MSELRRQRQTARLAPKSMLALVVREFSKGILRTAFERWFDVVVLVGPVFVQLLRRRWSSGWELLGPSLVILCIIVGVHLVNAVRQVWSETEVASLAHEVESPIYTADNRKSTHIVASPKPAWFRTKLWLIATMGIAVLIVVAYSVSLQIPLSSSVGYMQLNKVWFNDEHSHLSSQTALNIHVWIRNLGGAPVDEVYAYYEARLVRIGSDEIKGLTEVHMQCRTNALAHLEQTINAGSHGVSVGKDHGLWDTLPMTLGTSDIEDIKLGRLRIFIYAWARWRNAPHDLDFCEWLQAPKDGDVSTNTLIWHVCDPT